MAVQQGSHSPGSNQRVSGLFGHAVKKIYQPRLPVSCQADLEQLVIVFVAVAFKVCAQVQKGGLQNLAGAKKKNDQKATYPTVAIEVRMNRLKLVMHQRALDQGRYLGSIVNKQLPVREEVSQ